MTLTLHTSHAGDDAESARELGLLLQAAQASFAKRQTRATLDTLHAAHCLATARGLHRHAAQFKRALAILAGGGRPKLLARPNARLTDQADPQ